MKHSQRTETCPLCGSDKWSQQLLGVSDEITDPNQRTCFDCGCKWRLVLRPGKLENGR
jgi:hypothetical protein